MASSKFLYRLQKILDFRLRKEDLLKAELAGVIRKRDVEVAALNTLNEKRHKGQKSLEMHLAKGEVAEVQYTNAFLQSMAGKIAKQTMVVTKSNSTVEDIRKRLTICSKERKIMEKHKEKKRDEWKEEQKKIEAKAVDEMASNIIRAQGRIRMAEEEELERYLLTQEKKKALAALKRKKD